MSSDSARARSPGSPGGRSDSEDHGVLRPFLDPVFVYDYPLEVGYLPPTVPSLLPNCPRAEDTQIGEDQ